MAFQLDDRLAADTLSLGVIDFVDIRLMRDARYVWLVLVPQIDNAEEWQDLPKAEAGRLHEIAMQAADAARLVAKADKMNVAALGNMVRQLHVHVIARHVDDVAWPGPVWGVGAPQAYGDAQLQATINALQAALGLPT